MKKYLIVLAALAMVFVGCNQKKDSKYTKISFKQSEISISVGETYNLQVLYEPTTIEEAPKCEWSTSNAEVATVANGVVTAVAPGVANITAKCEDLTAVCKVNVSTVFGAYEIEDYGVFGSAPVEWVAGSDTTINLSWAGGAFNCRLGYWYVLAWDGNVTYDNGFAGEGYLLYSVVPFYTVDDTKAGEYNGVPFGWGSFAFKNIKNVQNNVGEAGKVNKDVYCEYMDSYVQELVAGGDGSNIKWDLFETAVTGAMIFIVDYDAEEPVWHTDYGLVDAVVKDMTLVWDAEAEDFAYEADIDWFDVLSDDAYFGLVLNEEQTAGKKPYELRMISEHYTRGDINANAPALQEPKRVKHYKTMPAIPTQVRKMAKDVMIKK
jgi:hypothetical protein